VAGALCFACSFAPAAELGRPSVLSRLGQALDARIEVVSLPAGEETTLAARMASRQAFRKAGIEYNPALAGVRISVERRAGRTWLRLRTSRPVNEPYLAMLLELQSKSGRQLAAYNLLLDPRGYEPPRAAPPPAAPPPAVKPAPPPPPPVAKPAPAPISREELFGLAREDSPARPDARRIEWRGFVQNYSAYDYQDPSHWSRAVIRTQLGAQGGGADLKWKATARVDLDPVYAASDFYSDAVRRDQRRDFFLRETYVDAKAAGLEWRLGKQNIVWGEMVGLFFADVVSARDQRDFILPDFDIIRIPQWALRAERFGDNAHAELVWLPFPEVDNIGKPGSEFYPIQGPVIAGFAQELNNPVRPARKLRNSNFGLRGSILRAGWDLAGFYYRSTDVNPTFYRQLELAPVPTATFTPRHERIWQLGATLAKDFGRAVAKAETIYTSGRKFNVTRLAEPTGVVPQDTLDYVVGLDFTLARETRLNLQYFERVFSKHDPDLLQEKREGGVTLLLAGKLGGKIEPELLVIQSVNRSDRLVRTKLGWIPARNWRITFGVDVFSGPETGFFGRFDDNDRVYAETRYDF
jgi:hypothetical protein